MCVWEEFTGHLWIPLTKAGDADVFCHLRWMNGWVNNREAGDLRRHYADYDVTVIVYFDYNFTDFFPSGQLMRSNVGE